MRAVLPAGTLISVIAPIYGDTLVSGVVTDIAPLGHTCTTTEVHSVLHAV